MRIAMLIEAWKPIWAGGQVHVWELCKRLAANHNCRVDLFVMNLQNKESPEEHFNSKLRIYYVGKNTKFTFIHRLKWCRQVMRKIQQLHKQTPYDIIHAHANLPGWPAKRISKKLGIPVIYTVHGSGLEAIKDMYGKGLRSFLLHQVERFLQTRIRYTKEISVDGDFLKYANKNKDIAIIPNGVDMNKYDNIKTKKSKKFKIIFVGRLHPQKGLKYLIEAVSLIKDKLKNVEFHIIGGGEQERYLKDLSKQFDVENLIKFRGKIYGNDLIKEYKSSNLFVLPSLYEGQPLTLLEAWAAKLPVLVTNVGGNRFFVNETNGYLIPSKNPKSLAITLLKAINNKNLKKMGLNGYKLVKKNYTWDMMAANTYEVYRDLVEK